jgi:hypothetical protein
MLEPCTVTAFGNLVHSFEKACPETAASFVVFMKDQKRRTCKHRR